MRYFALIISVFLVVLFIFIATKANATIAGWQYLHILYSGLIVFAVWIVRATALRGGKKIEEITFTTCILDLITGLFLLLAIYICLDMIAGVRFSELLGDYKGKIVDGIIIGVALGIPYSAIKGILVSGSIIKFDISKMNLVILLDAIIYSFLVTGFCLELFYRGFFYPELREFFPSWIYAAILIGFIDWVAHFGYFKPNFIFFSSNMLAFTLMGVICCYLYQISGNIISAVFFHAIVDFLLFFYAASGTKRLVI